MEQSAVLTQSKYFEEWEVRVDKDIYILNEEEIQILKRADMAGQRGLIWFEKFAIAIPYIKSITLKSKRPKDSGDIKQFEFRNNTAIEK